MSEIVIQTKQQRLIIDPPTRTVAVVSTGPVGPPGPQGPSGDSGTVPAGVVVQSVATVAPSGWLTMIGQTITNGQTLYANLWAVLPSSMKSGSSIVMPDTRGRVILGSGLGAGLADRVHMGTGGEENHLLVQGEMPIHNHTQTLHNHSQTVGWGAGASSYPNWDGTSNKAAYGGVGLTGDATPVIQNAGGGGAHNNMQPYIAMMMMIKT